MVRNIGLSIFVESLEIVGIDVLANSHLCEVYFSKMVKRSLVGWDWKIANFNLQGGGESFQVLVAKFSNRWLGSGSVEVVQAFGAWSHLLPEDVFPLPR